MKKARAPGKCKFFTWLALHDRCWIAERRKRHNLQDTDTCVLCAQESETIAHLLVGCSFSREVWYRVLLRLRWYVLTPDHRYFDLADWWNASRKKLQKAERKCFDSLVARGCSGTSVIDAFSTRCQLRSPTYPLL